MFLIVACEAVISEDRKKAGPSIKPMTVFFIKPARNVRKTVLHCYFQVLSGEKWGDAGACNIFFFHLE